MDIKVFFHLATVLLAVGTVSFAAADDTPTEDPTSEPIATTTCDTHSTQAACDADGACTWDGVTNSPATCRSTCATFNSGFAVCDAQPHCMWISNRSVPGDGENLCVPFCEMFTTANCGDRGPWCHVANRLCRLNCAMYSLPQDAPAAARAEWACSAKRCDSTFPNNQCFTNCSANMDGTSCARDLSCIGSGGGCILNCDAIFGIVNASAHCADFCVPIDNNTACRRNWCPSSQFCASGCIRSVVRSIGCDRPCTMLTPYQCESHLRPDCFVFNGSCYPNCTMYTASEDCNPTSDDRCSWRWDSNGVFRCTDDQRACREYGPELCGIMPRCAYIESRFPEPLAVDRKHACYSTCKFGSSHCSGDCMRRGTVCEVSCDAIVAPATPPAHCVCPSEFNEKFDRCFAPCASSSGVCAARNCVGNTHTSCATDSCVLRPTEICTEQTGIRSCQVFAPAATVSRFECFPVCTDLHHSTCGLFHPHCRTNFSASNGIGFSCKVNCSQLTPEACISDDFAADCVPTHSELEFRHCTEACHYATTSGTCADFAEHNALSCRFIDGACFPDCNIYVGLPLSASCPWFCTETDAYHENSTGTDLKDCKFSCSRLTSGRVCLDAGCSWDEGRGVCMELCSTMPRDSCETVPHCAPRHDTQAGCFTRCYMIDDPAQCRNVSSCVWGWWGANHQVCTFTCNHFGPGTCPTALCEPVTTSSFLNSRRCIDRCDIYTTKEHCLNVTNCGWYLNSTGDVSCRPRCSAYFGVPQCPDYCRPAVGASAECRDNCSFFIPDMCPTSTCIFFEGRCAMDCVSNPTNDTCLAPQCLWLERTDGAVSDSLPKCINRCDSYTTSEQCHHVPTCGWYRNGADDASCRPRCSVFRGATGCPDYCAPAIGESAICRDNCSYPTPELCPLVGCLFYEGQCVADCGSHPTQSSCPSPRCSWLRWHDGAGAACFSNCSIATREECMLNSGGWQNCSWNAALNSCNFHCDGQPEAVCPGAFCLPTNTSVPTSNLACTTRCSRFSHDMEECRLHAGCMNTTHGACAIACARISSASCTQPALEGQCEQPASGSTCAASFCAQLVNQAECASKRMECSVSGSLTCTGLCLWGDHTQRCTADDCRTIGDWTRCSEINANCRFSPRNGRCAMPCDQARPTWFIPCPANEGCEEFVPTLSTANPGTSNNRECTDSCRAFGHGDCTLVRGCKPSHPLHRVPHACVKNCTMLTDASSCDRFTQYCIWHDGACYNTCEDHLFESECLRFPFCQLKAGKCVARCEMLTSVAMCAPRNCIWSGSACHQNCADVQEGACAFNNGHRRSCTPMNSTTSEPMCGPRCNELSNGRCYVDMLFTACRSWSTRTYSVGTQQRSFRCLPRCEAYSGDRCPGLTECARIQTGPSAFTCALDCELWRYQTIHADDCPTDSGSCEYLRNGNPKGPCQPSCSLFERTFCPATCVSSGPAYWWNTCRPRCALLTDLESCNSVEHCVWDRTNSTCRDSCSAVAFAGLDMSQCSEALPYCVKHTPINGTQPPSCRINCTLAGRADCGVTGPYKDFCEWNSVMTICNDACDKYTPEECPSEMCMHGPRSTGRQCTRNCSIALDEIECVRYSKACVWLGGSGGGCVPTCRVFAAAAASERPQRCRSPACSLTSCRDTCQDLGTQSCRADNMCSLTHSGCDVSCSTFSTVECNTGNHPYCTFHCLPRRQQGSLPRFSIGVNGLPLPASPLEDPVNIIELPTTTEPPTTELQPEPPVTTSREEDPAGTATQGDGPTQATDDQVTGQATQPAPTPQQQTTPDGSSGGDTTAAPTGTAPISTATAATSGQETPSTPTAPSTTPPATLPPATPAPNECPSLLLVTFEFVLSGAHSAFANALAMNRTALEAALLKDLRAALAASLDAACGVVAIGVDALHAGSLHANVTATTHMDGAQIRQALHPALSAPEGDQFPATRDVFVVANGGAAAGFGFDGMTVVAERPAPQESTPIPGGHSSSGGSGGATGAAVGGTVAVIVLAAVIFAVVKRRQAAARGTGSNSTFKEWESQEMSSAPAMAAPPSYVPLDPPLRHATSTRRHAHIDDSHL